MRVRRNVTMHPMGLPRRSLKFEMSFRARVTTGR